jgi:uncharacterized protein YdeI (YjbR/CyaY-like superfamily)
VEIKFFKSSLEFREWLAKNHTRTDGILLQIFKKASGQPSITHADALDQALCYGWIDGQRKSHDALSFLQKFTPRRPRSGWSKINTQNAERLIKGRKMRAPGMKEINAAKKDGRWEAAYDSPKSAKPPQDFLKELSRNGKAEAFFKTLNRANVYSIVYRLQTAKKTETRLKRMKMILEMLAQGKKFHP